LELEERPAIWALAGQPGKALAEAAETRWASLWQALIAGQHPSPRVWESLSALEPYRAARLIFDCELVSPGVVPPGHVRRATATLRKCGATPLAEQLESCSLSSWRALRSYLARAAPELSAVKDLFAQAGYSDAHLIYQRHGKEKVLLAGVGGEQELSAVAADGKIILRTPFIDSVLEAFFGLICRDLAPLLAGSASTRRATRSEGIVGESPVLRQALKRLDRLAGDDLSILILGESGTGKELMAQRAHRLSRRAEGPFVPVNCAELSESLTQSDLFGHVKGAFTGADRNRPGIFETASSGTVFLDEIGDLPASAQGKLLRVLQEGEIRRVGESLARKINVRILAATHRDLAEMVQQGTFRQDLYFRLKVATVTLAPLRDRGHDVLLLADHFLARHHRVCRLTEGARKKLAGYAWPGNVRELQNVLRVAAALAPDNSIHSQHLDLPQVESSRGNYHQIVDRQRRRLISEAMSASGGNRAAAARRLGLTRQALSYLVKQLELD
ncbi:MAG: sigma 54-interacting transcriptional regulator, partial [Acidobacteriota bacterium]